MSRCGTFAICECGHLLALHAPPVVSRRACRALNCPCAKYVTRDDAARERAAYKRAMRGEL